MERARGDPMIMNKVAVQLQFQYGSGCRLTCQILQSGLGQGQNLVTAMRIRSDELAAGDFATDGVGVVNVASERLGGRLRNITEKSLNFV